MTITVTPHIKIQICRNVHTLTGPSPVASKPSQEGPFHPPAAAAASTKTHKKQKKNKKNDACHHSRPHHPPSLPRTSPPPPFPPPTDRHLSHSSSHCNCPPTEHMDNTSIPATPIPSFPYFFLFVVGVALALVVFVCGLWYSVLQTYWSRLFCL